MADSKYGRLFTEADVAALIDLSHSDQVGPDERFSVAVLARLADETFARQHQMTFPPDEPLFLLRGQDDWAEVALVAYEHTADLAITVRMEPQRVAFRDGVRLALRAFQEFARLHPDRVKAPG